MSLQPKGKLLTTYRLFEKLSVPGEPDVQFDRLAKWNLGALASAVDLLQATLRAVEDRPLVLTLVDLVSWCLQPAPDKRPQSMDDVLGHRFFSDDGEMRMSALHQAAALNDTAEITRSLPSQFEHVDLPQRQTAHSSLGHLASQPHQALGPEEVADV